MNKDLIVFGEDWGSLPSSTQHIMSHLAKTRKVLWINSIGLRRPKLSIKDLKRAWNKLVTAKSKQMPPANVLTTPMLVLNPVTIPAPRFRWERKLMATMLGIQIKKAMKKLNMTHPILWTSLPTAIDIAGALNEDGLVYYCGDDFSALAGVDHKTVCKREAELVKSADLIITASELLASKHNHETTKLLTHGVNLELFSNPAPRAVDLPDDGRPIAGFYGSISEWLDIELLEKTIKSLPDWHFVFIGKVSIDIRTLNILDNAHFLGERAHHLLPGYSQHWNVGLLPFLENAQIRSCNPLKLREYLATGRPIVSTKFPALNNYKKFVHTVSTPEQFISALHECVAKKNDKEQFLAVKDHDWSSRAALVSDWLDAL